MPHFRLARDLIQRAEDLIQIATSELIDRELSVMKTAGLEFSNKIAICLGWQLLHPDARLRLRCDRPIIGSVT